MKDVHCTLVLLLCNGKMLTGPKGNITLDGLGETVTSAQRRNRQTTLRRSRTFPTLAAHASCSSPRQSPETEGVLTADYTRRRTIHNQAFPDKQRGEWRSGYRCTLPISPRTAKFGAALPLPMAIATDCFIAATSRQTARSPCTRRTKWASSRLPARYAPQTCRERPPHAAARQPDR